jgi:predicted DNA-binding transcriptional regulator YafY
LNPIERFYRIDQLLNEHGCLPLVDLCRELEVSRATAKRDLTYMRDRLNAPIVFDRFIGGYRFEKSKSRSGPRYALPGLWFSADEIHALMTMNALLQELDPGNFIGTEVRPLINRLEGLLDAVAQFMADRPLPPLAKHGFLAGEWSNPNASCPRQWRHWRP